MFRNTSLVTLYLTNYHISIRLLHRCRTQQLLDLAIDNMIDFITQWNVRVNNGLSLASLTKYLKKSLGYTGSQWQGCIGDLAMVSRSVLNHSNTSSPMESQFASYYQVMANNRNELKTTKTILQKFLGINANGISTGTSTYWTTMASLATETRQRLNEPTDIRHSRIRAVWLVVLQQQKLPSDEHYILPAHPASETDRYFYVKAGVPDILKVSKYGASADIRVEAAVQDATNTVVGSFSFKNARNILIPDDVPQRHGYYTVDIHTNVCYLCQDYLKRGCLRSPCKHARSCVVVLIAARRVRGCFVNFLLISSSQ